MSGEKKSDKTLVPSHLASADWDEETQGFLLTRRIRDIASLPFDVTIAAGYPREDELFNVAAVDRSITVQTGTGAVVELEQGESLEIAPLSRLSVGIDLAADEGGESTFVAVRREVDGRMSIIDAGPLPLLDPAHGGCVAAVTVGSDVRCSRAVAHGTLCAEHRAEFVAAGLYDANKPAPPPLPARPRSPLDGMYLDQGDPRKLPFPARPRQVMTDAALRQWISLGALAAGAPLAEPAPEPERETVYEHLARKLADRDLSLFDAGEPYFNGSQPGEEVEGNYARSTSRPDWIVCILRERGRSFCGRSIMTEFHFLSVEHATSSSGSRLVPCPDCTREAARLPVKLDAAEVELAIQEAERGELKPSADVAEMMRAASDDLREQIALSLAPRTPPCAPIATSYSIAPKDSR